MKDREYTKACQILRDGLKREEKIKEDTRATLYKLLAQSLHLIEADPWVSGACATSPSTRHSANRTEVTRVRSVVIMQHRASNRPAAPLIGTLVLPDSPPPPDHRLRKMNRDLNADGGWCLFCGTKGGACTYF